MKKILVLIVIWSNLFSYSASCNTDDGKSFDITVKNKVMKIDYKYSAFYQGKTYFGWYEYSNKGYTYKVGSFEGNQFPIKVSNKWGLDTKGTCYFE